MIKTPNPMSNLNLFSLFLMLYFVKSNLNKQCHGLFKFDFTKSNVMFGFPDNDI